MFYINKLYQYFQFTFHAERIDSLLLYVLYSTEYYIIINHGIIYELVLKKY